MKIFTYQRRMRIQFGKYCSKEKFTIYIISYNFFFKKIISWSMINTSFTIFEKFYLCGRMHIISYKMNTSHWITISNTISYCFTYLTCIPFIIIMMNFFENNWDLHLLKNNLCNSLNLINRFDDPSFYFKSEIKSNSILSVLRNDFEYIYIYRRVYYENFEDDAKNWTAIDFHDQRFDYNDTLH